MISMRLKIEGQRSERSEITEIGSASDILIKIVKEIDCYKEIDSGLTGQGAIPRDVVGEWLLSLANNQKSPLPLTARDKRFSPPRD